MSTTLLVVNMAGAIGRTPGWLAQWLELVQDKDQKIARPKQIYTGDRELTFTPAAQRWA